MVAQLHLALVMAIDARLLVLDEPTLGLDILYRKQFYTSLLNDYFDEQRTILITTHQVEEVEHILTDLLFIQDGKIALEATMEEVQERYVELMASGSSRPSRHAASSPCTSAYCSAAISFLYDNADRAQLAGTGGIAYAQRRRPVRGHHARRLSHEPHDSPATP